jgi:hypothetical protein
MTVVVAFWKQADLSCCLCFVSQRSMGYENCHLGLSTKTTKSQTKKWSSSGRAFLDSNRLEGSRMVTLPPTFIRLRLEFGGCWQHTRLRPRGAVAARGALARRRENWLAQTAGASRCENAAEPCCRHSAVVRAPACISDVNQVSGKNSSRKRPLNRDRCNV